MSADSYFSGNTVSRDLFALIVGEKIGQGSAREVYQFIPSDRFVIKFETANQSFQNVSEWELWKWVKGTRMERWFAPCSNISACGSILIQERCEPLQKKQLPKRLPAFMCDLKRQNFGILNGRVVACDYGTMLSAIRSADKRLKKAEWWSE